MEKVIIRTDSAGVHFGELKEEQISNSGHYAVTLVNARRIWQWSGANCISELATLGSSDHKDCKISIPVSSIKLMAIEIVKMSDEAYNDLSSIDFWVTTKKELA